MGSVGKRRMKTSFRQQLTRAEIIEQNARRRRMKRTSGILSVLLSALVMVGLIAGVIALITALAGGMETMLGDIVDTVLDAVGRIGRAWRGE